MTMATYRAWVTDAQTGNEGVYDFEARDDLLDDTPVRVVRAFMEHVDRDLFPAEHVDYEINAALKHGSHRVVTAMGSFILERGPGIPFTLFIADRR
jgi:hypothetical protein